MRPLRLAVVVKNAKSADPCTRGMGYFSYPVPELTWQFIVGGKEFEHDTNALRRGGFDAILHEDFASLGRYIGSGMPLVYLAIDSTLSEAHYAARLPVARQADLVLIDQDRPERWMPHARMVRMFPYCVNDTLFRDDGRLRDVDVAIHLGKGEGTVGREARAEVAGWVAQVCAERGYRWRKGILDLPAYAASFQSAKVVINWSRAPENRPHRVFDAMASGAAVLTGPLPLVREDERVAGAHYWTFRDRRELGIGLAHLLEGGAWQEIAAAGHRLVTERHTWATRAGELRALLLECFPRLRERAA